MNPFNSVLLQEFLHIVFLYSEILESTKTFEEGDSINNVKFVSVCRAYFSRSFF